MNQEIRYSTEERWYVLWHRLGSSISNKTLNAYRDLKKKYDEPHRKYHNICHIDSCLAELMDVRSLVKNFYILELAIWYHDVIYDVNASDNEERSAAFAREAIFKLHPFPEDLARDVEEIILATKHNSVPTSHDAKIMLDIDIANLGKAEEFQRVNRLVREEYAGVAEEKFVKGRSNILELFLTRPRIYLSEYFYEKYEASARKNISEAITMVKKQ